MASKVVSPAIGRGFLRLKDFSKLLDENTWIEEIELSNYGEVFLNPDLLEIMRYASENKVILTINNGANFNTVKQEVLNGLVRYKVRSMSCSIDGASRETYAKYRVGGNYDAVLNNIQIINDLKKKYHTKYPLLSWQFILFGHNENELIKARRLAKSLKMDFYPKLSWDSAFSPCSPEIAKKEFYVSSREEYQEKYAANYMHRICHQLWDNPQINWDGKVLGCCRNFWGDFGSNVFNDGLADALNNENINYAKGMLLGINEAKDDIPCTHCDIYLTMKTNAKWVDRSLSRKLYMVLSRLIPHQFKYMVSEYI